MVTGIMTRIAEEWQLKRRTVFVSCSSDMEPEAKVVRTVLEELNRSLPDNDRWALYHWTEADETWSATGTWQQNIPRARDAGLVICLFGERLGIPLPDYFPCPHDLQLPPWVKFPWPDGGDSQAVPLTGTLFELLDAVQSPAEETQKQVLCYIKADDQLFSRVGLLPEQRAYGFEHRYSTLMHGQARIRDRSQSSEYDNQINLLDRFYEAFFRRGKHPYTCFGSGTEGRDGAQRALRACSRTCARSLVSRNTQGSGGISRAWLPINRKTTISCSAGTNRGSAFSTASENSM